MYAGREDEEDPVELWSGLKDRITTKEQAARSIVQRSPRMTYIDAAIAALVSLFRFGSFRAHRQGLTRRLHQCGLTLAQAERQRSHQARSGGTRYIFASPGLASCRRRPLSSNVSPHIMQFKRSQSPCSSRRSAAPALRPASAACQRGRVSATRSAEARRGPSSNGATRTQTRLIWLPPELSSVIDSSIFSLWFALRAAVLRLAVSQLCLGRPAVARSCGHGGARTELPMSSQSPSCCTTPLCRVRRR